MSPRRLMAARHLRQENAALRERVAMLAAQVERMRIDPVTALPTRRYWTSLAAVQLADTAAVLLIDLDRFKAINDTYGHAVGDQVLAWTGLRLKAICGADSVIGRLGGDEFVIATTRVMTGEDLDILLTGLTTAISVAGTRLTVSASLGIAYLTDVQVRSLPIALGAADLAMYAAKRAGGGSRIYHEPTHGAPVVIGRPTHRTRHSA